ncbi:MAG: hypothetical protein J6L69_10870 [Lachnospiraceae bacterium]|nr:hypothetical protein [Lachnospiraceae bacterium]
MQVSKSHGNTQYHYIPKDKNKRIYIRKNQIKKAKKFAQRDYERQFVSKAKKEKKRMELILENLDDAGLQNLHMNLIPERRILIKPVVLSDEEYIKEWINVEYNGKTFLDDDNVIMTERGERVRSKSEKIIADKLYSMGIPYRYEFPLYLKGYGVIYPDFTILDISTRSEKYIEHFGMMDDPKYSKKVVNKLENYHKNGIFLGKDLFATFEYSKKPLNIFLLENMLKEVL